MGKSTHRIHGRDIVLNETWHSPQLVLPRLLDPKTPGITKLSQNIKHQPIRPIRHVPLLSPPLFVSAPLQQQVTPSGHMLPHPHLTAPQRPIRERRVQNPPLPRMRIPISARPGVYRIGFASPYCIKLALADIGAHTINGTLRGGSVEQHRVRLRAEAGAVAGMAVLDPKVAVATKRVVKRR
ncbi:MAG: hypothetical protein Q9190_000373, partial [Brigantiaea leucoxantha]